jgi:hypothetical protein
VAGLELLHSFAWVLAFEFGFAENCLGFCDGIQQCSHMGSDRTDELFVDSFGDRVIPFFTRFLPDVFQPAEGILQAGSGADQIQSFHVFCS